MADRVQEFDHLRGRQVKAWSGVEMALREGVAATTGPQFEDPKVPCLQLLALRATLGDGTFTTVSTYQDDHAWGLWLGQEPSYNSAHRSGIYRMRALPELPTGEVDGVSVVLDEDVLAEVVLSIQGRSLLMMAGEVYESAHDRLRLVRLDESVLVFTDPLAAESVDWIPERRRPALG
jgi:hypothetical protein